MNAPLNPQCHIPTLPPPCGNGVLIHCLPPESATYDSDIALHPSDSNVVSQVPIYDSTGRIIGYKITSYAYNNLFHPHVNPTGIPGLIWAIPDVKHPISFTNANVLFKSGMQLGKMVAGELAPLGIAVVCPECAVVGKVLTWSSNTETVNGMVTWDAHLRTDDIYFSQPSPFVPTFPSQPAGQP